jgi:undecaprenyl diphosphate synthase
MLSTAIYTHDEKNDKESRMITKDVSVPQNQAKDELPHFSRLPKHVGFIPDGNRRWAVDRGLPRSGGYAAGLLPGLHLLEVCKTLGIEEASVYGFTKDNTRRPKEQTEAFRQACVEFANMALTRGVALLVLGDSSSPLFPEELLPYTTRSTASEGAMRVNLLANYGWDWDLQTALNAAGSESRVSKRDIHTLLASSDVSRIDLVVRWGGRRRLSGFLPVQSVYADFFVIDDYWPDYQVEQFYEALSWFQSQDTTLGG